MPRSYANPDALFDSTRYGFSQAVAATGSRTIHGSGRGIEATGVLD
jgi:hypothetical protein